MASKLPEDVMTDVLSRLPVKSLMRFQCVCKEWRSLFSSPYFTSLHLNHSISKPSSHSILVHLPKVRKSIPFDPLTFSPRKNDLNLCCAFGDDMEFVGSINGLLCISGLSGARVCLWNPSTRMFKKVETRIKGLRVSNSMGFGFDPIANDYKVVVIYSRITQFPAVVKTGLKVWSPKLDYWRDIKVDSIFIPRKRVCVCDVMVNGFAYWIGRDEDGRILVASFNMITEVLQLIPVPVPDIHPGYKRGYRGFIWKDSFALAKFDKREQQYQAWTLENDTLGWRKIFTFQLEGRFGPARLSLCNPINLQNGKLVYGASTKDLMLYDLETRKRKRAKRTKDYGVSGAHYYVESMVTIEGFKPTVEHAKKMKKRKRM